LECRNTEVVGWVVSGRKNEEIKGRTGEKRKERIGLR
jgi:hypothetical protein